MNMKKIYILTILSAFLITSCDLDREPEGIPSFWDTEKGIRSGLIAAYEPFYEEEGYGRGHFWAQPASDDMVINRSKPDDSKLTEFDPTNDINSSGGQYSNYRLMYTVIRRANDVLKYAPDVEIPAASKDIILGEANFLCGYTYFFLAKRFGGLAFYDGETMNKPRETKEQTYKNIEGYLLKSIEHFENQDLWQRDAKTDFGRPNLGAAYGLLAKVYAHWGKYKECKDAAAKVIGKYSLNTTDGDGFAHLFSLEGEKHEEVLFNLGCVATHKQGTVTGIILISASLTNGTGWYYFAPTKSLYNAFEEGDLRRKVTLMGAGDTVRWGKLLNDKKVDAYVIKAEDISDMSTGYMCPKYAAGYNKLNSWTWDSGKDIPLLRYSDVLLLHAEAEICLAGGGPANRTMGVAAAAESLNKVRIRAFGGDVSKAIATPTFNDLMKERRCELAYEDERHYDLVRWGLARETYAAATVETDPRGPRIFDPVRNAHFPLPQQEIENTGNVLINNPAEGYSNF